MKDAFNYLFSLASWLELELGVNMRKTICLCLFIGMSYYLWSQSCCSGGVPLSSNLGLPNTQAGMVQLGLSYDYNNLNTLKSGWDQLSDNSRRRTTESILLNWGLTLSNKLAIEGIVSYLHQERRITQTVGTDIAQASGFGDAVILLNYTLFESPDQSSSFRMAGGVKLPLGDFNQTNDIGIILNAELQPGSGAWDFILWSQWSQSFGFRPSMGYNFTVAYSAKGQNDAYLGDQLYEFGNEIQISAGLSDRILLGSQLFDPGISLRYRRAAEDLFNDAPLPATGGEWVFMEPSLSYWFKPNLSFNFNISFPVLAYVKDTQFSPTIRTTIGAFYRFALWQDKTLDLPNF